MLISNQNNTYLMKRMETFDTVITPVRRNVARKSTANRPLLNTIIKAPLKQVKKNDYIFDESIVSKSNSINNYPSYESQNFHFYYEDDNTKTSKRSLIDHNTKKYNSCNEPIFNYIENSDNSLLHESEDEDVDLSGIFCVSDDMTKYLDEGNISPTTNYDSSDESIDLSKVKNYPVKVEKCRNDQFSVSNKVSSPAKESVIDTGKNIKQELFSEISNEDNLQPIIVNHVSVISNDSSITELGTQTKKCLFDPNLESVTCKVKVREEVLVCENVPLKMTILEANFDVDHLENIVEDNNFKVDLINEKDDNVTVGPQVICAMSLGSDEKNELGDATANLPTVDDQKRNLRRTKRVSLKKEPIKASEIKTEKIPTVNEKRLTRSQMQVNNNNTNKRITRNSTRLNPDSLVSKDLNTEINCLGNSYDNEQLKTVCKNNLIDESQKSINNSINEQNKTPCLSDETSDIYSDQTKEDKDCKKKANLDKKGKKDINEGVLLHVEATKETELMRDGKIIKDKEEYLKDIESKIDQNLPVVVEKEFDIQQSLTEEILLDQALRLAHQRTSPRLSKIMKEAILKASVPKISSKPKQTKSNGNKLEIKSKENKTLISPKHNSEEADSSDSVLNNSTASESNSDKTFSTESLNGDVDEFSETFENQKKKKKENYVITPVAKQTNTENTVEPLTIKICRKANKKKTGFRLSLKKKRSPKKKEGVISKPVCSKDVNMDDLSKTFEDILQDDNWCIDDKISSADSENFDENAENKNINIKDLNDESSINTKIEQSTSNNSSIKDSEIISGNNNVEKSTCANVENPPIIIAEVSTDNDSGTNVENNDALSKLNNSKHSSTGEDSTLNKDDSIPLLDEIVTSLSNNNSKDSVSISSHNEILSDITSEKNSNLKLEHLPKNCNAASVNNILSSTELSTHESNKLPLSTISDTNLSKDTSSPTPQFTMTSSDIDVPLISSQNDLHLKNSFANGINKTISNSRMLENQCNEVHKIIDTVDQIHNQINNKEINSLQDQAIDILKCPLVSPSSDIQPKVLPLSIASRDPRLRKSHVRVIVEVSTSSVSNSSGKSDIQQETRIISQVMQNVTKEIDNRKDAESDSETNENQVEMDRRKKIKKREVDAELLYKTPLSDLHDIPERTSYTRSIRKRSPPKIDKRDPRTVRRKENNFLQTNDKIPDTYREYHEINIYSKMTHQDSIRSEIAGSPSEFKRNDNFSPDYRSMGQYRLDSHHPEHYNSFRTDIDLRRRENYCQNSSTEYVNEVSHTKDFTERIYQTHSDHHRIAYQYNETEEEYRRSENYPPDYAPPENYSRGYKRSVDFSSDHSRHDSPDFREKELVRERVIEKNHIPHNEPSYSRWDYAHKKVEGHFPPEINNEEEEKNLQSDERTNMWQEERDLIDGPVKSFSRPYYRRKKFSRGDELFERRTTPWDDNRRYAENERLWVRKTDKELIHGPDRDMRWDRRGRKGFRDVREERSRSPRRDHDRYTGKRSRSPGSFLRSRREASPSPQSSPLVLDSPMSPEPADRYCVLEPTKCLTVPQ